jgi:CysZ protein
MGWLFLVPALLWVGLTYGLLLLLQGPVEQLVSVIAGYMELPLDALQEGEEAGWWEKVKAAFNGGRKVIVVVVVHLAAAYVLLTLNKYVVLMLLTPLLAYVSERTEQILRGSQVPFSWRQLLRDIARGTMLSARNALLELTINLVAWVVTLFVPVLFPVTSLLMLLVSAYFYGFSMFDYVFERRRLSVGDSLRAAQSHLGLVLGNGLLFALVMKIPLIGIMCAPAMASSGACMALLRWEQGNRTARGAV